MFRLRDIPHKVNQDTVHNKRKKIGIGSDFFASIHVRMLHREAMSNRIVVKKPDSVAHMGDNQALISSQPQVDVDKE